MVAVFAGVLGNMLLLHLEHRTHKQRPVRALSTKPRSETVAMTFRSEGTRFSIRTY